MKAQICPKCSGQGTVSKPPWISGDVFVWSSMATSFLCDVCHGSKILYLPDDITENHDWCCGCGHWNGCNLSVCAACGREPNEDPKAKT